MSDVTDIITNPAIDAALVAVFEAILDRHKSGAISASDAIKEITASLTKVDADDKAADDAGKAELDRRFPEGEVTPVPTGEELDEHVKAVVLANKDKIQELLRKDPAK